VGLILNALHVYRNQLDTQRMISHTMYPSSLSPADFCEQEIAKVDAISEALRYPKPLVTDETESVASYDRL
jgi:hypothetical protein